MYTNRDLRKLLLPLIAEQLLTAFMGIADTVMVSNVGEASLSGVSLVDAINTLAILIFTSLSVGGTVVCAQYLGRQNLNEAKSAAGQTVLLCIISSILPVILGVFLTRPILHILYRDIAEDVMEAATVYFFITALSYPFLAIQQSCTAVFRAEGETKMPMIINIIANLINIAGNAILIFGFKLGAAGAALATLFSRIVNAVIIMIYIRSPKWVLQVKNYFKLRLRWETVKLILRIGVPNGLENGLFQFGKLIVTSIVATLGTTAISAHALLQMIEGIQANPSNAVGIGLTTVAGVCAGAGRIDEVKKYTKKLCWYAEFTMITMLALSFAVLKPILSFSALSEESSHLLINLMIIVGVARITIWVLGFTLPNTLRATGDATFCAIVSGVSMWVFRVGLSYILCRYTGLGLYGVWFGWLVDWVCRLIFFVWRYKSDAWTKKKVLQ